MAMIDTAPRRVVGAPSFRNASAMFANALRSMRSRAAAARTVRELERLSPSLRADIGVTDADLLALRERALF